jgi:arginine/lysine/ornithine decarboxylase
MFHQFFGENMLRADVCNSVDELGQLLDHTGPVAASERNAARIFNADHCYFVTNGTSTSNKMVWHHTVAPGDVVVVDRNCHKSILHAIIMTGSIPVFLPPTRNHYGIIGPIGQEHFTVESIREKIAAHPLLKGVDAAKVKPRILTLTQSTYDGVLYNTETIKHALDGYIDTMHFDEAWLPHAAFHDFYGQFHAMGRKRPRPKHQIVFATQSTHKLLAGISQASQVLVQDAQKRKLDPHLFNEAYLMHSSTSPQYAIIASCDVSAAMMEAPGGKALGRGEHRRIARLPAGDAQGRRRVRQGLVVQGLGPREARRHRRRHERRLDAQGQRQVARLRQPRRGLQPARPDQVHADHAGARRLGQVRAHRHPGGDRHQVPGRPRRRGREDGPLFVLHHVHHRHHEGPLEHAADALQQFKDDFDRNAPCWKVMPEFTAAHPRYERVGCATCRRASTSSTPATTSPAR